MKLRRTLKLLLLCAGILAMNPGHALASEKAPTEFKTIVIEGQINKPTLLIGFTRKAVAIGALEIQQQFTAKIVQGALKRPF